MCGLSRYGSRAVRLGVLLGLLAALACGAAASSATPVGGRAATVLTSGFNTHHNGWTVLNGSWHHPDGKTIRTDGVAEQWSALVRKGAFGDFTYEARMKRAGCDACANAVVVRSRPNAEADHEFAPGLLFEYAINGFFSVWRIKPDGSAEAVRGWTSTGAVVRDGWNVLKVVAAGSSFRFYINGTEVWQGAKGCLAAGRVGIAMYRDSTTGTNFRVDWAKLTIPEAPPG